MSLASEPSPSLPLARRFPGRILRTFLLVVIPLATIPLLLLGGATLYWAQDTLVDQINSQLNTNIYRLGSDIDFWLTTANNQIDAVLRQEGIQEQLDQTLTPGFRDNPDFPATREAILGLLQTANQGDEAIFDHFLVVSSSGEVLISSQIEWEKRILTNRSFFEILSQAPSSLASFDPKPLVDEKLLIFTHVPYQGENANAHILGVLNPDHLEAIMTTAGEYQEAARSYLITKNGHFFQLNPNTQQLIRREPSETQIQTLLPLEEKNVLGSGKTSDVIFFKSFDQRQAVANYTWLPNAQVGLVYEIPEQLAFQPLRTITPPALAAMVLVIASLIVALVLITQRLLQPIQTLTETAQAFAHGDWNQRVPVSRNDELGMLSYSFNQLADEISSLYRSMEIQVRERTRELETRSSQFEATSAVAREAAAIRDMEALLNNTTELISQHFGFYHAGIFMLDQQRRYAVLQAANSEGGKRMLARGHKLGVGRSGVVGRVAQTGLPRIALDVGADQFYFDNPDLPETRSEIALPLKVAGRVIGVLDVQSKEAEAFSESDAEVLQVMADQIALAIENARQIEETQQTVQELQNLYGEHTNLDWQRYLSPETKAYRYDQVRVTPIAPDDIETEDIAHHHRVTIEDEENGYQRLIIPIMFRDQSLGTIILRKTPQDPPWSKNDQVLAEEIAGQIAVALENARLLDEARKRVSHEQTVGEISTQIARSPQIESILKNTVRELGKLPHVGDVSIFIGDTNDSE
jgi:nitrate/nitrite-specific signal transduction histidine kinase